VGEKAVLMDGKIVVVVVVVVVLVVLTLVFVGDIPHSHHYSFFATAIADDAVWHSATVQQIRVTTNEEVSDAVERAADGGEGESDASALATLGAASAASAALLLCLGRRKTIVLRAGEAAAAMAVAAVAAVAAVVVVVVAVVVVVVVVVVGAPPLVVRPRTRSVCVPSFTAAAVEGEAGRVCAPRTEEEEEVV